MIDKIFHLASICNKFQITNAITNASELLSDLAGNLFVHVESDGHSANLMPGASPRSMSGRQLAVASLARDADRYQHQYPLGDPSSRKGRSGFG
jgi:hypothetical protein